MCLVVGGHVPTPAIALSAGRGFNSQSGTGWDYVRGLSAITFPVLKMRLKGLCVYVCVYVYYRVSF